MEGENQDNVPLKNRIPTSLYDLTFNQYVSPAWSIRFAVSSHGHSLPVREPSRPVSSRRYRFGSLSSQTIVKVSKKTHDDSLLEKVAGTVATTA